MVRKFHKRRRIKLKIKILLFMIISTTIIFINAPTMLIAQILFYQTMPNFGRFSLNSGENFDITQIEESILLDRYQNIVGIHNISDIITVQEDFSTYVSAFNLYFSEHSIEELRNVNTLLNRFYSIDRNTGIIEEYLNIDYFLNSDLRIEKSNYPQVLVFHTHAMSEFFIDSQNTYDKYEGVVGVGVTLVNHLRYTYGLNVIHYKGVYDKIDGIITRSGSYERIEPSIRNILSQYPTIQLVIDVHRDGVPATIQRETLVRYINGKPVAPIMFVNGLSAINEDGHIRHLQNIPNNYTRTNLALSFNLQKALQESFPGITRRLYLTPFRYINHLAPLSTLVEIGTQLNTKEEAHNATEFLAYAIYSVLFAQ